MFFTKIHKSAGFACEGRLPGPVILAPLLVVAFQFYWQRAGSCLFGTLVGVTFQFCRLRGGCVMLGLLLSVALLFAGCCCWLCSTSFCLLCCGLAGVRLCLHVVVLGMLCRLRALGTFCDLLCLRCL